MSIKSAALPGKPRAAKSARRRPVLYGAVLAVCALVLSACGVKIHTTVSIDTDGAGSRVISLELAESDLEYVEGGVEAADASIKKHLPSDLEFSGLSVASDGDIVGEFTMEFDSPADYKSKTARLLAAGDITFPENHEFEVFSSDFVQGVSLDDGFNSADLLAWMFNGLEADGVLDGSNMNNAYEVGEVSVVFNDIEYSSGQTVSLSETQDLGFTAVEFETQASASTQDRVIVLEVGSTATYNANADLYDAYFDELESAGFDVSKSTDQAGVLWRVSFTADSDSEMVDKTNTVLSSSDTQFRVEVSADERSPTTVLLVVRQAASCATICSPSVNAIPDNVTVPSEFQFDGWESGEVRLYSDEVSELTAYRPIAMDRAHVEIHLQGDGDAMWRGSFTFNSDEVIELRDQIEAAISNDMMAVDVVEQDGEVVFTVEVASTETARFSDVFNTWSGGSDASWSMSFSSEEGDPTFFQLALDTPRHIRPMAGEAAFTLSVHLPDGYEIPSDAIYAQGALFEREGSTLNFTTGSLSVGFEGTEVSSSGSTVLYILIGAVLVGAVVGVAVWQRRKKGQPLAVAAPATVPVAPGPEFVGHDVQAPSDDSGNSA